MSVPLYQRAKAICSCYTDSFTVHHPFLMQEYGVAAAAAGDRLSFEVNALPRRKGSRHYKNYRTKQTTTSINN